MKRRSFLAGAATGGVAAVALQPTAAAAQVVEQRSGADLDGWETVIGDGIWTAAGQAPVTTADIDAIHNGSSTLLRANTQQRGAMVHNIAFRREIDTPALTQIHTGSFEFRMPYLPAPGSWPDNAQTVEGGFFIWNGSGDRLDRGVAFQWILNPWMSTFGDVLVWTSANGGSWAPGGHLPPDTAWHSFDFTADPVNETAAMAIDGVSLPTALTTTPKDPSWGTEIAARLQCEIISLWPGQTTVAPSHRAQFRNWTWNSASS